MYRNVVLFLASAVCLLVVAEAVKIELLRDQYEKLGTKFDFYDQDYQNGMSTHITTDGPCKNLPRRWLKRPVAIDTRGTCGHVFTEKDCKGESTYVFPNNGEQKLSDINFAKKISSVQGCFYKGPN